MNARTFSLITCMFLFSGCGHEKSKEMILANEDENKITSVDINLNDEGLKSSISIDRIAKKVVFAIDTSISYNNKKAVPCITNLDSFERYTLVDSFYSHSFLDSIKIKPKRIHVLDGLNVCTIIKKGIKCDTINSGNVYPMILTTNIKSQLKYFLKNTQDPFSIHYIKTTLMEDEMKHLR